MYLPAHFAEADAAMLHAAIRRQPLATLVTEADGVPVADAIPLLLDPDAGVLRGHVARANPLWRAHPPERKVLAIFHGPQAYVSPGWYPAKAEHGKVVPTWNYLVVQALGTLTVHDDADWLRAQVSALTAQQEEGREAAWQVSDAPPDYIDQMLRAIVGLEIRIETLTGKWKASQNRNAADRAGVFFGLQRERDAAARQLANTIPLDPAS